MLSNEVMGFVALGIVWLNTVLIAADVLRERAALSRRRADLLRARERGELIRGTIVRGAGEGGAVAERRIDQIGRAVTTGGPDRILFTDAHSQMRIPGGRLEISGREVDLVEAEGEVWGPEVGRREPSGFDALWSRAATNKGVESALVLAITTGEVWVRGTLDGDRLSADLVASRCPIELVTAARGVLLALAVGSVAVLVGFTAVCFVPPVFGTVSTLGGVFVLGFFILVQPIALAVRRRARLPPDRLIGGIWQRPSS